MGGAAKSSTVPARRPSKLAGDPVRPALAKALAEARAAGRMTVEHEVRAVLAGRIAAAVDRAANRGDEAALLKSSAQLLELLDTLPIRPEVSGGGEHGDSGDGGRGRVLSILDGPPQVDHAADS